MLKVEFLPPVETPERADFIVETFDDKTAKLLQEALLRKESKNSKEVLEEIPELELEDFKIPSLPEHVKDNMKE